MANMILEKLKGIKIQFQEIEKKLSDPQVASNQKEFIKLNKEYKELQPLVQAFEKYRKILKDIEDDKLILEQEADIELKEMAKEELDNLLDEKNKLEEEIKILLLPKDPEDEKNAIVEIRAGTGGDEAAIFAGDLFRMYSKFAEKKGWKTEVTNFVESPMGGFKEIIFKIKGTGAYGIMKFESGVHRVQRVPKTESQGRIHTSAATVAVFPEVDDDIQIDIKPEEIRKDIFCASGPGGQGVNTTYSAVRLTHIPTGIVVSCQNERSQIQNYKIALNELKSRLYNIEMEKRHNEIAKKRKTMVSTGDRSAKIRTYNYPQNRVTDHRINLTLYNLSEVMNGNLDEITEKLQIAENAEKLKESF